MKYKLSTIHLFHGEWLIEASSEEEAMEDLRKYCSVMRGPVSSTLPEEDVNWVVNTHGDVQVTNIEEYGLS